MDDWSDELQAASLAAKFSGACSMIGSTLILLDTQCNREKRDRKNPIFLRILTGMSAFDICASSMFFIGSWAIPPDQADEGVFEPRGTPSFCTAQGALIQACVSVSLYNGSLATYYYLTVNRNWKDDKLKRYEWTFHIVPILVGGFTAIYGVAADQFHPLWLWCWFSGTSQSDILKFAMFYGPLWVVFLTVVTLFVLIYQHVRKQEKASRRFRFEHKMSMLIPSSSAAVTASVIAASVQNGTEGRAAATEEGKQMSSMSRRGSIMSMRGSIMSMRSLLFKQQTRPDLLASASLSRLSRPVFTQGALYAFAFIFTFLFASIVRTLQLLGATVSFPLYVCLPLFLPSQGFMNCLIYFKDDIWKLLQRGGRQIQKVLDYVGTTTSSKDHSTATMWSSWDDGDFASTSGATTTGHHARVCIEAKGTNKNSNSRDNKKNQTCCDGSNNKEPIWLLPRRPSSTGCNGSKRTAVSSSFVHSSEEFGLLSSREYHEDEPEEEVEEMIQPLCPLPHHNNSNDNKNCENVILDADCAADSVLLRESRSSGELLEKISEEFAVHPLELSGSMGHSHDTTATTTVPPAEPNNQDNGEVQ